MKTASSVEAESDREQEQQVISASTRMNLVRAANSPMYESYNQNFSACKKLYGFCKVHRSVKDKFLLRV